MYKLLRASSRQSYLYARVVCRQLSSLQAAKPSKGVEMKPSNGKLTSGTKPPCLGTLADAEPRSPLQSESYGTYSIKTFLENGRCHPDCILWYRWGMDQCLQ
ncbi:hypothetical protein VFPPC_15900 [Pochonia chlamydosporia 170]|uniref:Uncharacterized protein n=1 Tax=Pochonia chlamydosporia 170 TaxID=1380566 RepID=A0A179FTJ0_METCM|nr:hypothetical protein VFPPC_15900 [Pochonia chlamydosporia 170]OAQ68945.1 hypothetical protein VFPPC_15900 [Pochonia chlamydosporia 170]